VPWRFDQRLFKAWRQGRTGYPLVDAAMREVWGTGWMHNRMRVVAASFMVKNLLLPWQVRRGGVGSGVGGGQGLGWPWVFHT
jgi:deoxyribodipyrimidine photolyase